jgi:hypothetical protein
MQRFQFFVIILICFFSNTVNAMEFKFPEKLPEHPRLFLTKQREAEIKQLMKTDEFLAQLVEKLITKADRSKRERTTDYRLDNRQMLLMRSRRSLERPIG